MEDEVSPDELIARHVRAARRARAGMATVAALATAVVATVALAGDRIARVARGETDLSGRFVYAPSAPANLAHVDLASVHARLVPAWVIAEANAERDHRPADRAWARLRRAVAPDRNLAALADALHESVTARDRLGEQARVEWVSWAWNDYLEREHAPYRLEAGFRVVTRGVLPWSRSYRVTADVRTSLGRARLVTRLDRTNVVEPYLGHSGPQDGGAIVVVDRVLAFATHDVWPALDPALDAGHHDRRVRALAPHVRSELEHALSRQSYALLRSSAIDETRLVDTLDAIHGRRRCGSDVVLREIPFHGISPDTAARILDALGHPNPTCPRVTSAEARLLWDASGRLSHTAGVDDALGELTAWVARGVVEHELRHAGDFAHDAAHPCPDGLDTVACDEARAYLVSFADPESGYVSLLGACQLLTSRWRGAGPNEAALAALTHELLPDGCTGAIPDDLPSRAATLARTRYGVDATHVDLLGASFPTRVAITR